ncbi:MAG: hypothetical protein HQ522_10760 [Bacteroidetes bacterium]|nr:hypothetical protein [Bacteroidota bacterium]
MKDIKHYGLNTKALLREVLEMNSVQFPKEMKKAIEKYPDKFSFYSELAKTLHVGMFVIICEHFGMSHDLILDKIAIHKNVTDPKEIERIARWLGLKLSIEEIRANFGGDNFKSF